MDREVKYNRLEFEKSPYLRAHMTNKIDWYPWGEEAFKRAVEEDKLIFLSIGYSSCKWCHKMTREVFSDSQLADILNEKYISVKVDKEERPDIDKQYMLFSEALTGITGWPLTMILTPDRVPIYSGNYLELESSRDSLGIKDILNNIDENWKHRRQDILKKSKYIELETDRIYNSYKKGHLSRDIFKRTAEKIGAVYDYENGGFFESPKFPLAQYPIFLLHYQLYKEDKKGLAMAENNLKSMYRGSIYDHIGGGFFRYSAARDWNSPHFEKMLGENAIVAIAYILAYQVTKEDFYRELAEDSFKFILRELRDEKGGFYTGLDPEYKGVEGGSYYFTRDEIVELLGEVGEEYCDLYNIYDHAAYLPNLSEKNIHKIKSLPIASINDMLYEYRVRRGSPKIDRKILTSTNGLLMGVFAYAGSIFEDQSLIKRAEEIYDFLVDNMMDSGLKSIYIDGDVYGNPTLLDYAYFLFGLINLYISTEDDKYLERAKEFSLLVREKFWDDKNNILYFNALDERDNILNIKDKADGSMPSSVSVMAYNWVKLYKILGDSKYYSHYRNMISSFSGDIIDNPNAHIYTILTMFFI